MQIEKTREETQVQVLAHSSIKSLGRPAKENEWEQSVKYRKDQ